MFNIKCFYVYILTNRHISFLYTGVTNDLKQRIHEHYAQRGQKTSFTGKFHVYHLPYFEPHKYINNAITREKEIKGWTRQKKMKLINEVNPSLKFLNEELFGTWPPKEIESRVLGKNGAFPLWRDRLLSQHNKQNSLLIYRALNLTNSKRNKL